MMSLREDVTYIRTFMMSTKTTHGKVSALGVGGG